MAAFEEPMPQALENSLRAVTSGSGRRSHVFDAEENTTRTQNAYDLREHGVGIVHSAKDQGAKGEIYGLIREVDRLGRRRMEVETYSEVACAANERFMHVGIWFQRNNAGSRRQISEVGACSRAKLHHRLRCILKQKSFAMPVLPMHVAIERRQEPRV